MKKKLISAENISEFLSADAKEIYIDSSMILTSGAKDYLRDKKVKISYTKRPADSAAVPAQKACQAEDLKVVVAKIVSILKNDLQVSDAAKVESVTRKVLCSLQRN